MERITASWLASAVTYSDRLKAGLLPRFPEMAGFLDPHNLGAICVANVVYLAVVYLCVQRVKANGPFSDSLLTSVSASKTNRTAHAGWEVGKFGYPSARAL